MIEILNPLLLGGLAGITAPILIHLWHRRQLKRVDWGAMRFLLEMMARHRRRLLFEEILLLLVRSLLIACVALAMVRPAFHRRPGGAPAQGFIRQGRTAAVVLIDDSVSTSAGRAQSAFETMKTLGLAYLDSLAPGDEVSVLLMSQLGGAPSDPVFDIESLKQFITHLKPSFVATDVPALLEAGLSQLKRHLNPGAELVLLSDGRKDGWREQDLVRWSQLRDRLRGPKEAIPGTRPRPQILVLSPEIAGLDENLTVTDIAMERSLVTAGQAIEVRVTVANYGPQAAREAQVQLSVNGQVLGSKPVTVPAGGQQEAMFVHTFEEPGSYAVEAVLLNHPDWLPADDRRALAVQVESRLPVLLVEGDATPGLAGKLGFLEYALEPEANERGAFKVTRIPATQLNPALLAAYRLVVLGDVRVLDPAMVDALERFVVGGGGVLVGLGPDSDLDWINRYWARNGEGFLPCPLGRLETPVNPAVPATIQQAHPVFRGFGSKNDEAWKSSKVRSYFKLDRDPVNAAELEVLLRLDNGDPLVVARRRGLGMTALIATSLNADWTELPMQAAYVPLLRGLSGYLGGFIMPPRNLAPGDSIIYTRAKNPLRPVEGEDLRGHPLKLSPGAWEGREAWISDPVMEPGAYLLRDPQEANPIRYAVALAPAESALLPLSDAEAAQVFNQEASLFHRTGQIAENLDPARRQSVELWRWFLVGAMGLMFLEAWLTRREAGLAAASSRKEATA